MRWGCCPSGHGSSASSHPHKAKAGHGPRRRAAAMALLSHHTGHVPGQLQLSTLPRHCQGTTRSALTVGLRPPGSGILVKNFHHFSSSPNSLHSLSTPGRGIGWLQHRLKESSNDDHLSRHHAMSRLLVTTGATTTSKPHSTQSVNKDLSLVSGVESYCIVTLSIPIPRVRSLGLKFGSIDA
jgi:hypothetical protein